jgi:glycosyltransferase involved in cell wall biosynthesis
MKNLLFLTPILNGSGNYSTANRLITNFKSYFKNIYLENSTSFNLNNSLDDYLNEHEIDLIICIHAYHSGRLFYDINLKQPIITILGGTDVHSPMSEWLPFIERTIDKSKYLICFSEDIREALQAKWSLSKEKCVIIPQGVCVSPDRYFSLQNYDFLDTNETKIISWVGTIRKVKDPLFIESILPKIQALDSQIIFLFAGYSLDDNLANRIKQIEVENLNFRWLNGLKINEAHTLIKQSWAFINTSINEGMSLAILEAMMLKCPVLARNNFGNKSIVINQLNGLLYDTQNDLFKCIRTLLRSDSLRNNLIENAFKYVNKNHSCENELEMYLNLIK